VECLIQDPTLEEYENRMVESKLREIDELTNGDTFGEYAAILKEQIKYSAVTCMPTEVITVDIIDFVALGRDFGEAIIKFSKVVPEDKELRRALIEMNRWVHYKESLTKSVKANQLNKNKGFD